MLRFENLKVGMSLTCKKQAPYHLLNIGEEVLVTRVVRDFDNYFYVRRKNGMNEVFYEEQLDSIFIRFEPLYVVNQDMDCGYCILPEGSMVACEGMDFRGYVSLRNRSSRFKFLIDSFDYYFTPLTELIQDKETFDFKNYKELKGEDGND